MATRSEIQHMCGHLDTARDVVPDSPDSCPECLAAGDRWVHLRECQTCGHVGCCDSSKNKHATAHHHTTGHPMVRSFEPGEGWWFCYTDDVAFELDGAQPARPA